MSGPTASTRRVPTSDAERWLDSLEQLFPIPDAFRDESFDRRAALDTLRCGDKVLDALIQSGLPCSGEPGDERFDRNDLFNLALYSRSERSVPEIAFRFALRWLSDRAETWFEPKRWHFSLELSCGRPDGCRGDAGWTLARPRPDVFGGTVDSLEALPEGLDESERDVAARSTDGVLLRALLETRGDRTTCSPRVRAIAEEFMSDGYRWVRMPEALERDPSAVLPHGAANCICASLELERRYRSAGYPARTRRGWLLGMFDFDHTWVEVEDEDDRTKVIDVVFPLLAAMVPSNPEFARACIGSRINRLLPTLHPADEPLAAHTCGGASAPVKKKAEIRRARV